MLPVVQKETIATVRAQNDRDGGKTLNYVSGIGKDLSRSQPHMKEAICHSVRGIMEDLAGRGVGAKDVNDLGAALFSMSFMIVRSIEAQVEVNSLEQASPEGATYVY